MARCPHCEQNLDDWERTLQSAPDTNAPQVWTCPSCDAVLGVSSGQPR